MYTMTRQLHFTAGPCCTRCRTPTGGCATKFSCAHHLTNLSTAVKRKYERDTAQYGQIDARQRFEEGRDYLTIRTGMTEAGVPHDDATEWIQQQMEELRDTTPELFEVELTVEARVKAWAERWMDGDTRR